MCRSPRSSTIQEVVARGGSWEKGSETKTFPPHSARSSAITFTWNTGRETEGGGALSIKRILINTVKARKEPDKSRQDLKRATGRTHSVGQQLWVEAVTGLGVRRLQREHRRSHSLNLTLLLIGGILLTCGETSPSCAAALGTNSLVFPEEKTEESDNGGQRWRK